MTSVLLEIRLQLVIIISCKKEQLLNSTVKPKPSLNLSNRIVCKPLEILFHLWNTGKKKVKVYKFLLSNENNI